MTNYNPGDIIEIKRHRGCREFLVDEVGTDELFVFNLNGKGRTRYKVPFEQIVQVIESDPEHPWLTEPTIKMDQVGNRWIAMLKGDEKNFWADGETIPEAVGNFVILHGESLGIKIEKYKT